MSDLAQDSADEAAPKKRGILREKAFAAIKAAILNGDVQRGERLSEARLMRDLDIGRTPLREALNRLEREGLVVSRPSSGYSLANLDIDAVCDLLVVRAGLDAMVAEIAAETATDDDLWALSG